MNLLYTPEINARIERLDKIAPPPRDVLTIDEAASVLDMDPGSLSNMKSQKRLPFQVLKVGGSVKVDKIVLARYMAGIKDDNYEQPRGIPAKPKNRGGRPKNSVGLQRHAANLFLAAFYKKLDDHKNDVSSVLAGKTFKPYVGKRLGE